MVRWSIGGLYHALHLFAFVYLHDLVRGNPLHHTRHETRHFRRPLFQILTQSDLFALVRRQYECEECEERYHGTRYDQVDSVIQRAPSNVNHKRYIDVRFRAAFVRHNRSRCWDLCAVKTTMHDKQCSFTLIRLLLPSGEPFADGFETALLKQ